MPIATTLFPQPSTNPPLLPPPQTFDLLPPLHALLSRLLLSRDPTDLSTPSPETVTASPISPKELGAAASTVTNKIQKARLAVRELPGVEMSLEEQKDLIEELEEEVERLGGVLEGIRSAAREVLGGKRIEEERRESGDGDVVMET